MIQKIAQVSLKVTAPASAGTTATTIDLSQVTDTNGTSEIFFGDSGSATQATVTTSGGTPNDVTINVRHKVTGTSQDDMRILALISAAIRGSKRATATDISAVPKCLYLIDQRGVSQTFTMSPVIQNVDYDFEVFMFQGKVTTLSPYNLLPTQTTDVNGQFTVLVKPCGYTCYDMAVAKAKEQGKTVEKIGEERERRPRSPATHRVSLHNFVGEEAPEARIGPRNRRSR